MGTFSRLAKLSSVGGRVAGSYLGQKVRAALSEAGEGDWARLHLENAERVVETLGQMKGVAMKVGQGLSVALGSLDLPPELRDALGKVHDRAEPVPFDVVRRQVESELDGSLERLFERFDPEPIGTASLGQAHRARLRDGRPVVVKVLHAGIEDSVGADLLAVRGVLVGLRAMRPRDELDASYEEIRERITEELDYRREAANLAFFRLQLGSDTRVRVPAAHPEFCTSRVLTMDELPGRPIEEFLSTASPEAKQRAGLTLAEVFYRCAYELLAFQADPHPGNFLFEPDGRVGLLDFGCVKRLDPVFMRSYAATALAAMAGDRQACVDGCRAAGVFQGHDPEGERILWSFCWTLAQPYQVDRYSIGGAHDAMHQRMALETRAVVLRSDIRAPRELLFLHRTLGGLYTILRRLQPDVNLRALLAHYGGLAVARVDAVPWPSVPAGVDVGGV